MNVLLRSLGYLVFGLVFVTSLVLVGVVVKLAIEDGRDRLHRGAR